MNSIYDAPKGETERTWALVRQVSTLMDRLLERKLLKVKLTPERVTVLQACRNSDATTAELSRLLCRQNQTITGMVNRLETEGLIRRAHKRKGQWFTKLVLTEKGEKAREAGWAVLEKTLADTERWLMGARRLEVNSHLMALRDELADKLHIEVLERPE